MILIIESYYNGGKIIVVFVSADYQKLKRKKKSQISKNQIKIKSGTQMIKEEKDSRIQKSNQMKKKNNKNS